MGWGYAVREFFSDKGEVGFVGKATKSVFKLAAMLSIYSMPVTFSDEELDVVPGINLISGGDDIALVFGAVMLIRILMFRHRLNREIALAYAESAQAAY